jgi:XTP/dITP diphosphohydrolase
MKTRPTVYVATSNEGKLREMEALFVAAPFVLATFAGYVSPAEGDASYSDNAALKARALHGQLRTAGHPANVLADDSGLEVEALGGRPGVLTAEYGGSDVPWNERRRRLLAEIAGVAEGEARRARFVCALHLIDDAGRELSALGAVEGEIAMEERGELGFSFDPIFYYPPLGRTFAELTPSEKNGVSHRAVAASLLRALLRGNDTSE